MNADRWGEVERVCREALAREPAARPAFVDQACAGDPALRREVEQLLAGEARAAGFLEEGPLEAAARALAPASVSELPPVPRAPLARGTRLGPYAIDDLIGAGGMGEVYRARDTRLDRTVAIKILPADVSANPDRRARFEREAKTIAGLNHPHICTLHDVGEHDRTTYLVMEYLQGETLAACLGKGPLPLDRALSVATEIADALAAAHRQGVVHRDLKPGNVMLTKAGAKLLDFGLAKLKGHGEQPAAAGVPSAPTEHTPQTAEGLIVGTLQYMAPEQVDGRPADARTDLWALGAILYEMLTGKRAFEGTSAASLIGNIMHAEPPAVATLQPLAPPAIDHLVKTCLAKDPEARWQAASDVARQLRWVADESRVARTPTGGLSEEATALRRWRRRVVGALLAVAAVVAFLSAVLTWVVAERRTAPEPPPTHLEMTTNPAEGLLGGWEASVPVFAAAARPRATALALSPNGRQLVFTGRQGSHVQLYVRDFAKDEAEPIPHTEGADMPFLSPDGQWVGFWTPGDVVKKMPLDRSTLPSRIANGLHYGASWGDDGTIVFVGPERGLMRLSSDGEPEPLTTPAPGELGHFLPHMLPGARAVLFTVVRVGGGPDSTSVWVYEFAKKAPRQLVAGAADARYLPTGHLVCFKGGELKAATFGLAQLKVLSHEVDLLSGVMQSVYAPLWRWDLGAAQATISTSGTLAYVTGGVCPDEKNRLIWVDRRGRATPLAAPEGPFVVPRLDRDNKRVAVAAHQSMRGIFWHDLAIPDSLFRVTPAELAAGAPLWSQDGRSIVFAGVRDGRLHLFLTAADGSQPPEVLDPSGSPPDIFAPTSWTPDGQLLFLVPSPRQGYDIWLGRKRGGTWSSGPVLDTEANETGVQVSPNGKWLAYTQSRHVFVIRFPDLKERQQVSIVGGRSPVWSRDGSELFYVRTTQAGVTGGDDEALVVHTVGPDGVVAPEARELFRLAPIRALATTPVPPYDVTRDGRFLFVQAPETTTPPVTNRIQIVQNWFEEVKAKLPVR